MTPSLSGQTSIFGVVFFVSKFLLGIERQKKSNKKLQFWPESLGVMLEYKYAKSGPLYYYLLQNYMHEWNICEKFISVQRKLF